MWLKVLCFIWSQRLRPGPEPRADLLVAPILQWARFVTSYHNWHMLGICSVYFLCFIFSGSWNTPSQIVLEFGRRRTFRPSLLCCDGMSPPPLLSIYNLFIVLMFAKGCNNIYNNYLDALTAAVPLWFLSHNFISRVHFVILMIQVELIFYLMMQITLKTLKIHFHW